MGDKAHLHQRHCAARTRSEKLLAGTPKAAFSWSLLDTGASSGSLTCAVSGHLVPYGATGV